MSASIERRGALIEQLRNYQQEEQTNWGNLPSEVVSFLEISEENPKEKLHASIDKRIRVGNELVDFVWQRTLEILDASVTPHVSIHRGY